jgi:predicted nucleic acid-binding protein
MVTPFILDCSVTVAWFFKDEHDDSIMNLLISTKTLGAVVPALWNLEIRNALLYSERKGRLTSIETTDCFTRLANLPISVEPSPSDLILDDILKIARHYKLTVYDAAYLELALRRKLPLASKNEELRHAAGKAGLDILPKLL